MSLEEFGFACFNFGSSGIFWEKFIGNNTHGVA
jgi:hypothetical protein